jgi:hypothetical protein
MKMLTRLGGILLLLTCLLPPAVSSAVTLGQIDDFQDGTVQGWLVGFPGVQPLNVPTGGPAGAGDHYLLLTADGAPGQDPNNKLVVINQTQWSGNFLAAGVNAVNLWVNNLGATDLYLRLYVADDTIRQPANTAISTNPVFLPAGSGWAAAHFPLNPAHLTALRGNVQQALTNAREVRIFHNPAAAFPGPIVVASLGVDNIRASRQDALPYLPLLLLDD